MAGAIDDSQLDCLSETDQLLISQVTDYVKIYFQDPKFDASHDFNHVMRVVHNALAILRQESRQPSHGGHPVLDVKIIVLGALLHDVGDRKYVASTDVGVPLVKEKLIELGMADPDASTVQDLVDGVSYSSEVKAPERVQALIQRIPELAIVQDADRLDAVGAIGIGRCFTFGGARSARSLEDSLQHFEDKLLKLKGLMKTESGRKLATDRTSRVREFMSWWKDEMSINEPA